MPQDVRKEINDSLKAEDAKKIAAENARKAAERSKEEVLSAFRQVQANSDKVIDFVFKKDAASAQFKAFVKAATSVIIAGSTTGPIGVVPVIAEYVIGLFFSHPSSGITIEERLGQIQRDIDGIIRINKADWDTNRSAELRIVLLKTGECIEKVKNVRTRFNNNEELYPWTISEGEEALLRELKTTGLLNFRPENNKVWLSIFQPKELNKNEIKWVNYLADLVPIGEKNANPPSKDQPVFDDRGSKEAFIEFVGTYLMMIALRTPQFRSLGNELFTIKQLIDILDYLITENQKIYYFDTNPDAYWSGPVIAGGGGGGRGFSLEGAIAGGIAGGIVGALVGGFSGKIGDPTIRPDQKTDSWGILSSQSGVAVGAVHPGKGIGIVRYYDDSSNFDNIHDRGKTPVYPSSSHYIQDNVFIDQDSANKLLEYMGVPILKKLREQLYKLSQTPTKSETVFGGIMQDFKFWTRGNETINIEVKDINFECYQIQRFAHLTQFFNILPQRTEITDIPQIEYGIYLRSNSDGSDIKIELGNHSIKIKTDCYNTLFMTQSDFDSSDSTTETQYFGHDKIMKMETLPVFEKAKEVNLTYNFEKNEKNGKYSFMARLEEGNLNAIFTLVIKEKLPIISQYTNSNIEFETQFNFPLIGNAILVPDELLLIIWREKVKATKEKLNIREDLKKQLDIKNPLVDPDYKNIILQYDLMTEMKKEMESLSVNTPITINNLKLYE